MKESTIEKMKKIIEENKKKSSQNNSKLRAKKNIGGSRKAIRNKKTGGLFDKQIVYRDKMNFKFIHSKGSIIEKSEYTVLDSDNAEILEYILKNFKDKTKFILDPVSAEKAKNIRYLIKYFHTIKPNIHEAEILAGFKIESIEDLKKAGEYFISLGIQNVFISLDAEGIYYKNRFEEGKIKAHKVTVKFAIAMSNLTIAHENTINPNLTYDIVENNIKNIQWIEEYL